MSKLDEALETLYNVCDDNQCEDGCPLYKLCQCIWANSFYPMSEVIEDEFRLGGVVTMKQEAKNHLDMYWIEDMFIYSFRYTLGRMSYAPSVCMDFLEPLIPYMSSHTLEIMSNEIGEYALGESQSPDEWHRFKNKLDDELAKRE